MSAVDNRLLRASAGTGKTYQLVQAYLAEVRERGLRPGQIVAITFTRKAAAELKSRIRRGLRAAGVERGVLAELSLAPIANFHGLALHLLRSFGLAGELPEGVEVLGEHGDDRLLFVQACEEAWFGGDEEMLGAVEQVAPHLAVDQGLPDALWQALARAREDGHEPLRTELFAVDDPAAMRRELEGALEGVVERLRAARPTFSERVGERVDLFLSGVAAIDENTSLDAWADGWLAAARSLDRRGKLGKVLSPEDLALLRERVREPVAAELSQRLAPALRQLARAAWSAYEERKRVERVVDFGDLVAQVVELLSTRVELHARLRQEVRAVLVDEAQDTNRLQRRLVRLLAGLEGPAVDSPPARLFVVGDRKQAIYTFRGADPESFAVFAEDVRGLGGSEEVLVTSRRSAPELVAGINHLGRHLFAETYEPLEALPDPTVGRVSLGRPGMTWLKIVAGEENAAQLHAREARAVARWVRAFVDSGRSPGEVTVLFAYMSRAPLYAQALTEEGIASVLGGGGGFYEQAEVVDLVAMLVWLTDCSHRLAAATALRSPLVGLSETELFELFAQQREVLASLRAGMAPAGGDDEMGAVARLAGVLPTLVEAAGLMPAEDLVRLCIEVLDARAVYAALPGGEQRLAHLDRLIELARRFSGAGRGSAALFAAMQLEHVLRRHSEPVATLPAGARRAVTLSSVHQAKGLEFPLVLLADLGHRPRRDFSALRYVAGQGLVFRPRRDGEALESTRWRRAVAQVELESEREMRRLLYVAVTRARQEVVFVGPAELRRREGFARLLGPWRAGAIEAGLLATVEAREEESVPGESRSSTAGEAERRQVEGWLAVAARRGLPPGSTVELSVTAFESFGQCLRRGHFVHDLKLDEPGFGDPRLRWPTTDDRDPPLDPLSRGRLAHAVLAVLARAPQEVAAPAHLEEALAGEGYDPHDPRLDGVKRDVTAFLSSALGRDLWRLPPQRRRPELPFRLAVPAAPFTGLLHGQLDLFAFDDEGPLVVDYKHARPPADGVAGYTLQLTAYAAAVARLCEVEGAVRTRLVFLREGGAVFEYNATPNQQQALLARFAEVVCAMGEWRGRRDLWPGQPVETCRKLGCGFVDRCHRLVPSGVEPISN